VVQRGKRARLSASQQGDASWPRRQPSEDVSDEMSDDVDDADLGRGRASQEDHAVPPASQYQVARDGNFEHLQHAEDDDLLATQRLKDRSQIMGENRAALNAVIESIEVFNFMCHERLKVELGPLLNFIVGQNGSGKSAILTAITLCLGGKASSTNRGASLKSFIKEGQQHGSIVVKIKNQGTDAYKHDVFGDSIIVERNFSKNGTSNYKLKSASGRTISSRKDDVLEVVDYYCLQVDNPLNVLSQDNARQFLNAATPALKYKYFLQGTQLQQLDDDLSLIHEHIDATEMKLTRFEPDFEALTKQMEEKQKLKETAERNVELRRKNKVHYRQLAWAQVAEQESILQDKENAIIAASDEITSYEQGIEEMARELDAADERIADTKRELGDAKQEEGLIKDRVVEAKEAYDKVKGDLHDAHRNERELREQLKQANDSAQETQKKIRDEETRLEELNGGAVAEKQNALEQARAAAALANTQMEEHVSQSRVLDEERKQASLKVNETSKPIADKRGQINAVESRIKALSQNQGDPLAGFAPQTRKLLDAISRDKGFSQKPIGPLGMYVTSLKPAWSSIIERVFGDNLDAFIVADSNDRVLLARHMEQLRYQKQPTIYISRPGKLISTLQEPQEHFDTILRVLKFDDERVRNQLVITNQIEQMLLIEDADEAWRTMTTTGPPQNVKVCYYFHPKKRGEAVALKVGRGENTTTDPVFPSDRRRMKSDSDVQVNHQKEILRHLESELKELDASKRVLQQEAQKRERAVAQHKSQESVRRRALREAEVQVNAAETALDQYDGADARLRGLLDELEKAKEQEAHYGRQFGELSVAKDDLNKATKAAKVKLSAAKGELEDFSDRITKIERKIQQRESARGIQLVEKNDTHMKLEVAKEAKAAAERSRNRQQDHLEDYIQQAAQVSPERVFIPEGETYQSIERKFQSIKEQLKKFEQRHGKTEQQVHEEAADALEAYEKAKRWRKDCRADVDASKLALKKRLDKWKVFQRHISASARTNFQYLLSERGFRGRLLLDHEHKKLGIEVEPDQTRQNVTGRNTKTLSGGEKSFSSICLLLAIWDAMGSPLRCLDEFDVFMDVVNRAISTKMLVSISSPKYAHGLPKAKDFSRTLPLLQVNTHS
jgi:structural maintenance of chromosomes protein 6